jgi:hypothetical protein
MDTLNTLGKPDQFRKLFTVNVVVAGKNVFDHHFGVGLAQVVQCILR